MTVAPVPSARELAQAFRLVADWFDAQASNETQPAAVEWVGQKGSPLGARRHIAAVRRRVAAGEPGAAVVGRSYRLTRDALNAELGHVSAKHSSGTANRPAAERDELSELRRKLEGRAA